ncbi:similarities to vacuolar protein sorting-associated protein [Ectocarpus siliculosus]|uniref:Similarities to vacuolar protein sorting-associated protein n=1 Tax=Ectocarpus siliculosus TaxID=2880 RepID=D8LME1_ECTSI|nr:similarities to vacuolar protein sorting-associated protein [Ectocarpus siliculosus]|eukprot:CBN77551.1 similarities to vacuolar protein sorting-associated protein [Ectocarpus siliculosus]
MRLREKMGAEEPLPGGLTNGNDGGGGGGGGGKPRLVKDSRRSRGGNNIGDYTRTLWNSLGAGDNAAAAASAATDQHSGGGVGRGGTGDGGEARSSSGGGGDGRRYLVESANINRTRLLAFAETLAAGESALSPGVFEVGGGQRAEVKIYFALMHLHPLDVRITYRGTPGSDVQDAEELTLSTMAQLNDARLCLNALQLEHAFGGRAVFAEVMLKHYKFAFLSQVHKVVGSFDFLGDPVGLLSNLSTGVKDFFYEPIEGLKPDGKGFLYGLGKGGTSLVSNTMQGTFNTFNKVTGSLGDTISQLSLDTDYRKRRVRERLVEGETMADSMAQGAKEFGRGIFQGVTGVVMEPYLGAEKEGVLGFGKGMVKGVVGVAIKPVVGVFDLGTRAFEGIRNASRMDEDSDDDGTSTHRPGGEVGGPGAAGGLLSLRARPPRMFGPLGEMDPFTWEAAVAQAVLRAGMRDEEDFPSERIRWFRRLTLRARHLRGLVIRSSSSSTTTTAKSKGGAKGENAESTAAAAEGGRAGGGVAASSKSGDGSSSSPDEAFVTRWVIVTDKRMLHAQEEPGWGADKEKVKTLDLARFGVAFSPWSPALGGVRVLWDAPLSSIRSLTLEPAHEGVKVELSAPVEYSTDHQGSMGPEFAQIHLVRPHKYSICLQGHLIRMHSSGLLTTLERHWYAVANGILYEYTPRKDALPDGSNTPPPPAGSKKSVKGGGATARRPGYPYTLTTVLPLSGVSIKTGRIEGNEHSLKDLQGAKPWWAEPRPQRSARGDCERQACLRAGGENRR